MVISTNNYQPNYQTLIQWAESENDSLRIKSGGDLYLRPAEDKPAKDASFFTRLFSKIAKLFKEGIHQTPTAVRLEKLVTTTIKSEVRAFRQDIDTRTEEGFFKAIATIDNLIKNAELAAIRIDNKRFKNHTELKGKIISSIQVDLTGLKSLKERIIGTSAASGALVSSHILYPKAPLIDELILRDKIVNVAETEVEPVIVAQPVVTATAEEETSESEPVVTAPAQRFAEAITMPSSYTYYTPRYDLDLE